MLAAWWNGRDGDERREIFLRTDGRRYQIEARDVAGPRHFDVDSASAGEAFAKRLMQPRPGDSPQEWKRGTVRPAEKPGQPAPPSHVAPGPYPPGRAPFGGQPLDYREFLNTHGKKTIRRWLFTGGDPHQRHYLRIVALPDGRHVIEITADPRLWVYPGWGEADRVARLMRQQVHWKGRWVEISAEAQAPTRLTAPCPAEQT